MTVLYIVNTATGPGSGYGSLTPVAPATSVFSAAAGWKVGTNTASTGNSVLIFGTIATVGTFTAATALATNFATTTVSLTTGRAWRSILPLSGSYSSATAWNLSPAFCAVSTSSSQTGRIRTRIWKSASTAGATATQLTIATAAGFLTGSTSAVLSKTTASASFSSATWTPTGIPSFNNEYLFIQQEWNVVAAGGLATADSYFVGGATWSQITTSLFTHTDTLSESVSSTDTQSSKLNPARATVSESVAAADTVNATVIQNWSTLGQQEEYQADWKAYYPFQVFIINKRLPSKFTDTVSESVSIADAQSYPDVTPIEWSVGPAQLDRLGEWWTWYRDEGQVQQSVITIGAPSVQTIAESVSISDTVTLKAANVIAESVAIADSVDAGVIQHVPRLALTASLRFRPYYLQTDITRRRSGPVVWTDSVAESVSINDTQSYIAYDLIAAKLFDWQKFPSYYPQTFVERKRSAVGGVVSSLTVAESVVASDTVTAKLNPARKTIAESVAPADTVSAKFTTKATISESVAPADTLTRVGGKIGSIAESVTSADTVTAKLNPARATVSESVAPSDTVTAKYSPAKVSVSESVVPADTVAAKYNPAKLTVTESVAAADSVNAIVVSGSRSVSESVTATDTFSVKLKTVGLVNEIVFTVDLYRYPTTQTGTISESVSIRDLLDGFNPRGLDTHDGVTRRRRKKGTKYDPFAEETAYRQKLKSDLDKAIHPVIEAPSAEAPVIEAPQVVKPEPQVDRYAEIARRLNEVGDYVGLARRQIIDKIHREQELSYAESRRTADAMLRQMQAEREAEEEEDADIEMILRDIYG